MRELDLDHIPTADSDDLRDFMVAIERKWKRPIWDDHPASDEKAWAGYYNLIEEELIRRGET